MQLLCLALLLSECVFLASDRGCSYNRREMRHMYNGGMDCERKDGVPQAVKMSGKETTFDNIYLYVTCGSNGWTGYTRKDGLFKYTLDFQYATCVKYCEAVGEGLEIIPPIGQDFEVATSCEDPTMDLYFNGAHVAGNRAECMYDGGWKRQLADRKNAASPQPFECRKAPTPCLFNSAEGIHFDDAIKTLTCPHTGNVLKGINHNGNLYPSVKCGRMDRSSVWKAWTGEDFENSGSKIAEASPTLNVSCVEYCTSSGDGIEVRRNDDVVEVTCTDPALGLMHGESTMENGLANCSINDGWKTGTKLITKDVNKAVQFKCAKPCVLQSANGILFDKATNTFNCAAGDASISSLLRIVISSTPYNEVKCEIGGGWRGKEDNGSYTSIDHAFIEHAATCVNYCASSGNGTVVTRTPNSLEVSCADSGLGLSLNSDPMRYKSLKCDKTKGWRTMGWKGEYELAKSIDRMDFSCEKYEYECDMPSVEGFHYDSSTKTLSCNKGDAINVIEYNSKKYDNFLCDVANGWAGKRKLEQEQIDYFKLPNSPLTGKCVEYCAVTGTGINVEKVHRRDSEHIRVSCPENDLKVLVATVNSTDSRNGQLRISRGFASCRLNKGWFQRGLRELLMTEDVRTPMQFECQDQEQSTTPVTLDLISTTGPPTIKMSSTEESLENAGAQATILAIGGIALVGITVAGVV